jgi:hypothetical protein
VHLRCSSYKGPVAYRYSLPGSDACRTQWRKATALAPKKIDQATGTFLDQGNDEIVASGSDAEIESQKAFTCMLQKHALDPIAQPVEAVVDHRGRGHKPFERPPQRPWHRVLPTIAARTRPAEWSCSSNPSLLRR